MPTLFDPLAVGDVVLPNRIVMAPMTRSRADEDGRVGALTATYYGQRASAGLIISEGIFPSRMGKGYVRTPGLASAEHVRSWRAVTEAVHARGGRIFAQLMHVGRISIPAFLPGGATPVAPSPVAARGQAYTDDGMVPLPSPRALTRVEIQATLADYQSATERAFEAGFDGVELHAASGYLPEQFLSSGTNQRTDEYGGSLTGRLRFVLEALDAMSAVRGAGRVGIKVAPELGFNDVHDAHPRETYAALVRAIAPRGLAYLHVSVGPGVADHHAILRPLFAGPYFAGGGFDRGRADDLLARGGADGVVFGSAFIANPDLPARLATGAPLQEPDRTTFYTPGPAGYIDYPPLAAD